MTIDYVYYGVDGSGNIRLQARCDSSGTCTLTLSDGRTMTAEAVAGTNDGYARFEFAASSELAGSISHGGETYKYPLRIRPLPTDRLRIAHSGCQASLRMANHAWDLIDSADPDLIIHYGDIIYSDGNSGVVNGETTIALKTLVVRDQQPEVYLVHYRAAWKWEYVKKALAARPILMMWDDHEVFDGYCHGINQANKFFVAGDVGAVEQCTTQAQCDAIYTVARAAWDIVAWTNPPNTDAGVDSDALYFRVRVGNLLEIIVPDIITYRDLNSGTAGGSYTEERTIYADDDPAKSYLYPTQKTWMKTAITNAASSCAHVIVASTKQTHQHNADADNNSDTWTDATVERDELLDHCADQETSIVWITNDSHQPAVYRDTSRRLLSINSGSISSGLHQQGVGYAPNVAWKAWGYLGDPDVLPDSATRWVFGWSDVTHTAQTHSMIDALYGKTAWGPWTVAAGADPSAERRTRIG